MAKTVELLLTENVDNLGIVGDVVKVRTGYARNYLLPRAYATTPSDELLKQLAAKREEAKKQLAAQRKQREELIGRLADHHLELVRSCNDQGILYGAVTQQEIAKALTAAGYPVSARDVRVPGSIKRIDKYDVTIKFAQDLETRIHLDVKPDREIKQDDRVEMEFDEEGELVVPGSKKAEELAARAERDNKKGDRRGRNNPLMGDLTTPTVKGWGPAPTAKTDDAPAAAPAADAKGEVKNKK